jgi:energy-coupling factor transporter ATP-binding protein EcfA2
MAPHITFSQWRAALSLFPYVWQYKQRFLIAMGLLVCAKLANVSVPLVLKEIVDHLQEPGVALTLPMLFIVLYGLLRFGNTAFTELRDALFARVLQRAMRGVIYDVFRHLHAQSLRFHLERRTGGLAADIERGSRSIRFLINFSLFNIAPTLLEILMVAGILFAKYDPWFGGITLATLCVYIFFTVVVTNWRLKFRRSMNETDAQANARAVDSLLNYETVKYFNNEDYEARRLNDDLRRAEEASVRSEITLAWLNAGQAAIIAVGVAAMMGLAANGVAKGTMTLGDLVLVNAYLIQLFIPLNFLGTVYREIRNALTDMEKLFGLLHRPPEIVDAADATPLRAGPGEVRFEHVSFAYDPRRAILDSISFTIPAGRKLAVVGASGAGKSTLSQIVVPLLRRHRRQHLHRRLRTSASLTQKPACAVPSAWFPRTRCCSTTASITTSPTAAPTPAGSEVEEAARAAHLDRFIAQPAGRLRHRRRRARPEALRRREAARRHRPRRAEKPVDPGVRRGDLIPRQRYGTSDPGRIAAHLGKPHDIDHCPPPLDRGRCRRDPGAGQWPHRRARRPCRTDDAQRPLRRDVAPAVTRRQHRLTRRRRTPPGCGPVPWLGTAPHRRR